MKHAKSSIDWQETAEIALFLGATVSQVATWQQRKGIPKGWAKAIELEREAREWKRSEQNA